MFYRARIILFPNRFLAGTSETHVDQQEALGIIGVNLLYGAFYHRQPEKLIASLQENLAPDRIEVDMIKFSGRAFSKIDNRFGYRAFATS